MRPIKRKIIVSRDGVKRLKCSHCHEWFGIDKFSGRASSATGLQYECMACHRDRKRSTIFKEGFRFNW